MNEKILTSHELEALQEVCNPDFFQKILIKMIL